MPVQTVPELVSIFSLHEITRTCRVIFSAIKMYLNFGSFPWFWYQNGVGNQGICDIWATELNLAKLNSGQDLLDFKHPKVCCADLSDICCMSSIVWIRCIVTHLIRGSGADLILRRPRFDERQNAAARYEGAASNKVRKCKHFDWHHHKGCRRPIR